MEQVNNLQPVIDSNMCIGCGACEVVDTTVSLRLNDKTQTWLPDSPGGQEAASVCPAIHVDYEGLQTYLFPGESPGPFGVVRSVYLAQSTNIERNVSASSGGLIKEILRHLLRTQAIDGVIALDHVEGIEFSARLLTDPDDVDNLPGSIYHNLVQTPALELLRDTPGRLAIVAIPCQLEGLYAYVKQYAPELRSKIEMTIGLLCGWQYSIHSINAMGSYLGFEPKKIEKISYRGGGPIGKFAVTTDDGRQFSASRRVDFSYQVAFDRHFNTPRCHLCVNHINFLADLVVGDAWLPSTLFTKSGISLLIARTEKSDSLIGELITSGSCLATRVSLDEIRESQTERVVYGEFAYAYADLRRQLGLHTPILEGPNASSGVRKSQREVAKFHRELVRKQKLMEQRRYRLLRWRKGTLELPKLLQRYLRWFFVRVIRIKSLSGARKEVPRSQFDGFR